MDSPLHLSPQDVERLINEEASDVRIDVLKKVAEGHSSNRYSPREFAIAEQIFRALLRDTEIHVREALADALKDNPNVPRDIILALSRDEDTVAWPVIESSQILTDSDLIALIQTARHIRKPLAVAKRAKLSPEVSIALIHMHNPQVVTQLVKNPGAELPEGAFQDILRDHSGNKDVMDAVASRAVLPLTIAEKLITLVSDALAQKLRTQYHLSPATIAVETEKTREIATLKLVDGQAGPRDVEKLVDQLHAFGRLTPSIILTSLCRGNLYFFETSLARLSHIPVRNAQLLIHDKGSLGFKALYNKGGLPEKFFAPCQLLLEVVAGMQRQGPTTGNSYANALAQKLLAKAAGQNIENLSYIIALIRQNA